MLARYAIPKLIGLLIVAVALFVLLYRFGQPFGVPRERTTVPIAWRPTLEAAFSESRETGRPVFLEWTAEWCGPCQEMERGAFQDAVVVELLNEQFVPIRLNWDRKRDIATDYRVRMLPTMQVFSAPDQVERFRLTAKQSPAELESFLRSVLGE